MAKVCKLCEERQREIDRILKGYRADKAAFRKKEKIYLIAIGVLVLISIVIAALGPDGVYAIFDFAKEMK